MPRRRKLRILRFGLWAKSSVAPLCPTEIPLGDSASPQRTHFVGLRRGPFRAAPCIPVGFIGTGFDESARRVFALVLRPNFNQGAACHVVASSVSFVLAFGAKSSVAPLCPTEIPLGDSSSPHQTRFAGLWRGPQFLLPPPSCLLRPRSKTCASVCATSAPHPKDTSYGCSRHEQGGISGAPLAIRIRARHRCGPVWNRYVKSLSNMKNGIPKGRALWRVFLPYLSSRKERYGPRRALVAQSVTEPNVRTPST